MGTLKYSRQRESIKDYLDSTTAHPTADIVYEHVKAEYPNISLGTVYRNLNLLADIGEAIKITTPDGADRFDARTENHYHIICSHCGAVDDLMMDDSFIQAVNNKASEKYEGQIDSHSTLFFGLCKDCLKKNKKK